MFEVTKGILILPMVLNTAKRNNNSGEVGITCKAALSGTCASTTTPVIGIDKE
jgi:hypothetical protein